METTESPTLRLYAPGQIAIASFLGAPMAACWFIASNYQQLGQLKAARQAIIWGVMGTLALFVITFFLPKDFPNVLIPLGYTFGIYQTAKLIHGAAIDQHVAAGGLLGSWWRVVGISLVIFIIIFALLFGVFLVLPEEYIPAQAS